MIVKNISILTLGVLLSLAISEIAARYFYDGLVMSGTIMTNDPELGFAHRKGASVTLATIEFENQFFIDDELGVRVGNLGDQVPINPDYVVYGDSMAFGYGVEFDETFSEILNRKYHGNKFLNAGVYSYGPDQEYLFAKRLRNNINAQKEIVLFFTGNDFENFETYFDTHLSKNGKIEFGDQKDSGGELRRIITNLPFYPLLCKLHLYHWVRAILLQGGTRIPPNSERFPLYKESDLAEAEKGKIDRIAALFFNWANEVGKSNLYVIIVPHLKSLEFEDPRVAYLSNALAGRVQTFNYIDYLKPGEKEDFAELFYPIDTHWNEKGHAITAKVLERILY